MQTKSFPPFKFHQEIKLYISEAVFVIILLIYFLFGFYYHHLLLLETKIVMVILTIAYLLIFLPLTIFKYKADTLFKSQVVFSILKRFFLLMLSKNISSLKSGIFNSHTEKQQFLFVLIKIIFIPIMLNFFIIYVIYFIEYFRKFENFYSLFSGYSWFFLLTSVIFSIDTLFFSFGYIVESKRLNNMVKSVDPTLLGWLSALACYKPFNNVTYKLFPFFIDENIFWKNELMTTLLYVSIIIFYLIFVWATLALGHKCSNLTNRGIVSRGPYRFVRHPAYSAKIIAWCLFCIPVFNFKVFISMLIWTIIYFIRAYTEEKHLANDPDYLHYCEKVRYRFIPFIY